MNFVHRFASCFRDDHVEQTTPVAPFNKRCVHQRRYRNTRKTRLTRPLSLRVIAAVTDISEERVESSFRGSNTSVFRTSGHKNQLFTSEGLRRETSSNGDANSQACAEEQYVAHAPLSCRGHVHSNDIAATNEQGVINGANSAISFTIIEPNASQQCTKYEVPSYLHSYLRTKIHRKNHFTKNYC